MKARIELAADLSLVILPDKVNRTVMLETLTGVDYGHGNEATTIKTERAIFMTKAEARAVASALMGCAAEL